MQDNFLANELTESYRKYNQFCVNGFHSLRLRRNKTVREGQLHIVHTMPLKWSSTQRSEKVWFLL